MKLCVLIPALNEEATIGDVIRRVPAKIAGIAETVVLVVDDGSSDRTREIAEAAGARVIAQPENRGVGQAFQTGVDAALEMGADYLVNIDADGQFDPEDIPKVLAPILEGRADFATASRFKDPALTPEMSAIKLFGNRMMSRLVSRLTGRTFYDVSCGFRAYSRDALQRLNLFGGFTYTQETFLDLSFKGLAIREVPLKIRGTREHGESRVAGDLPRYAWRTSKIIFRSFRDYRPMRVFGWLALAQFIIAAALGAFLMLHYWRFNSFTPHKWAGFSAGFLLAMAFLTFMTGLFADMLARIRMNQDRILYLLKRKNGGAAGRGRGQ